MNFRPIRHWHWRVGEDCRLMARHRTNCIRLTWNTLSMRSARSCMGMIRVLTMDTRVLLTSKAKARAMAMWGIEIFLILYLNNLWGFQSGSPLTFEGRIVAVVNWGIPCARGWVFKTSKSHESSKIFSNWFSDTQTLTHAFPTTTIGFVLQLTAIWIKLNDSSHLILSRILRSYVIIFDIVQSI